MPWTAERMQTDHPAFNLSSGVLTTRVCLRFPFCVALSLCVLLTALDTGCAAVQPTSRPRERATVVEEKSAPVESVPSLIPPNEPDVPSGVFHQVEPGQTLWRIARAYGVSLESLVEANPPVDSSSLPVGLMLFVPGAKETLRVEPHPAPIPEPPAVAEDQGPPATVAEADYLWPVPGGRILSGFGAPRGGRRHAGLDIRGERGQDVLAARRGEVVYSGNTFRGYGKMVILDHGDETQSLYAHGSELLVKVGDVVERGVAVARIGRTGNATTDHCHFEIRREKVPVDPLPYFPDIARRLEGESKAVARREKRRSADPPSPAGAGTDK